MKPFSQGIYFPETEEGPLPEKNAMDQEVILQPSLPVGPPVGPPPTYDGHYKDVDTVSMMSVPPAYDVPSNRPTSAENSAIPAVEA